MELINNINKTLRDDIVAQMKAGSRLSIAASCFSIYAFQELKAALKDIKELRFIFTSPTFTTEKTPKQQREFYIPRLDRERTLYGSEFEVLYANPQYMQSMIGIWSNKWYHTFERWIKALDIDYDPLENYDRREEWMVRLAPKTGRLVNISDSHRGLNDVLLITPPP